MVFVGKAFFLRYRSGLEIRKELIGLKINISESEIHYLGQKFIAYLALAHGQKRPDIKKRLQQNGGYVLHLDGTCDGGSPFIFCGIDSLTKIVLDSVKITSEKAEKIVPFLKRIKQHYGTPLAIVRDMSKGIANAVACVFDTTQEFICHFHFLRDIGKDLLQKDYDLIKKRLKTHSATTLLKSLSSPLQFDIEKDKNQIKKFADKILSTALLENIQNKEIMKLSAYSLIQWCLAGKTQGHGYGFPFDRTDLHFVNRIAEVYDLLSKLELSQLRASRIERKPLMKLREILKPICEDSTLQRAIKTLESKIEIFDQLRDAMRMAPKQPSRGLNDDGDDADVKTIEKQVEVFYQKLKKQIVHTPDKDYQKFIDQLEKYWEKLFADPIIVDTPKGKIKIQPQRTNNIIERLFRSLKRIYCRKSGHSKMNKVIQTVLAETPLVKNLNNPEYMKILLAEHRSLEELFSTIDYQLWENFQKLDQVNKIPPPIKKMLNNPRLPDLIIQKISPQITQ